MHSTSAQHLSRSKLLLLTAVALLTGCAGQHVLPPAGYSSTNQEIVRVAFDQEGNVYPQDISRIDWTTWRPSWWQKNFGGPFRLRSHDPKPGHPPYEPTLQTEAREAASRKVAEAIKESDTLVVMIHGFNNQYQDAAESFDKLRSLIRAPNNARLAFIEVYWDGLTTQSEAGSDRLAVASFWPDALTYSNLAGQCGLRRLLASIDRPVRLRFVTHSRGVAVALATIANPVYNSDITVPCGREFPPLAPGMLIDTKIAAFAPAVGNGHINDSIDRQLSSHRTPVQLLLGVNEKDRATSKSLLPASFYGDTRLGSDLEYVKAEAAIPRAKLRIRAFNFTHGSDHPINAYLERNPELASCMLTLIDLGRSDRAMCNARLVAGEP